MRRQYSHLLLALLLLFTQQVGTAHLAGHSASQITHEQHQASGTTKLCLQCSLFASVHNSVPSVSYVVELLADHYQVTAAGTPVSESLTLAAYQSRAPPVPA